MMLPLSEQDPLSWIAGVADEDTVTLDGSSESTAAPGTQDAAGQLYDYRRFPVELCVGGHVAESSRTCVADVTAEELERICPDGTPALDPVFRARMNAGGVIAGPYGWYEDDPCPEDVKPGVDLSAEDFRRLPLVPSVPSFQPASGRGLVNMELIVFTDPGPQVLQTMVLGTPVTVRATPTQFWWEFGDGSEPLVTTDPGAPYPEFRVFHVYEQVGSFQVQLTTMWSGEFQVNGQGPWFAVTGTAQTVSPAFAETVVEARSHLVDEPLP